MASYKKETINAYDSYPDIFDEKFQSHFNKYVKEEADSFLKTLSGKKILDLGSGPGNHAQYFKSKGFDVLCLDLSDEMLKLCKSKGLKTIEMDIENLSLPDEEFDGIWAYASLLHVPRSKIQPIINKLTATLKKGGILALALKEGTKEGYEENEKYPKTRRWFTNFSEEEISELFRKYFKIEFHSRRELSNYAFLNYRMRKLI